MSESDIHIPDEALEAAARKLAIADGYDPEWWDECISRFGFSWGLLEKYRNKARAACLAMLRAGPGMFEFMRTNGRDSALALPLPQEPRHE